MRKYPPDDDRLRGAIYALCVVQSDYKTVSVLLLLLLLLLCIRNGENCYCCIRKVRVCIIRYIHIYI